MTNTRKKLVAGVIVAGGTLLGSIVEAGAHCKCRFTDAANRWVTTEEYPQSGHGNLPMFAEGCKRDAKEEKFLSSSEKQRATEASCVIKLTNGTGAPLYFKVPVLGQ